MTKLSACLRWAAAAATLAVLLLLGWQCIDIYLTGNSPANLDANGVHITPVYTWENVGGRLSALALPLGGYAVLLLAAVIASAGRTPEQSPRAQTPANRLRLMKRRFPQLPESALAEEKRRRNVLLAMGAALLVCCGMCLVYLLNGSNFVSWDLETVMGDLLLHIAPWVVLGFAVIYAASVVCDRSMLRECEALRGQAASAAIPEKRRALPVGWVRVPLYAAAVLFILLGVLNGGWYDVLVKAINICTECIGLG